MSFRHYNPNPERNRVGDCTVRAISKALNESWDDAYDRLCAKGFELGDMPSADAVWGAALISAGFRRRVVPDTCPVCYTVRDFAADHPRGTFVVAVSGHVLTVQDGDWFDSWDSGGEIPIYYYFREA